MDRPDDHEEVAARFFAAVNTEDLQQLMDLMAPDVVLLTDGGGKKRAALHPILRPAKVSRWFLGTRPKVGDISVEWGIANGAQTGYAANSAGHLDDSSGRRISTHRAGADGVMLGSRFPPHLRPHDEQSANTRGP
jgi:hypothetical protein